MDGDGDLGPARLLALRHGLTIVTNSAQITPLLADSDNTVYALGGQVRATSLACVGMWTLTALRTLRADIALIGTNGVLGHTGPCTSIYSEAEIKTAMVQCAKKSIVLCDGSKFREEAVIQFADWQQIDCLITDQTAPEAELAVIRQKTTVLVAGTQKHPRLQAQPGMFVSGKGHSRSAESSSTVSSKTRSALRTVSGLVRSMPAILSSSSG